MRLTVLGASPWVQNPGGACSGYLVETQGIRLLLDCGPGVVGKLRQHLELDDLDAILISHLHADHCFDLMPYHHGLRYGPCVGSERRPALYVPPDDPERIGLLAALHSADGLELFAEMFRLGIYLADEPLRLGDVVVQFRRMQHYVPTYGMRIESGGRVLIYSADTGPCQAVEGLAQGGDLFVCEATFLTTDELPRERGHLTAAEAGAIANRAGVGRLILTHFLRGANDERRRAEAAAAFGGEVLLAEEGRTYQV